MADRGVADYYGFTRPICACSACKENCRHLSGMVSPKDVERWHAARAADFDAWVLAHLAASPGALVARGGQIFRIPTIVPRRLSGGRCHWLTSKDLCAVHETAPYGCAAFTCTQTHQEGDLRSQTVLAAILRDWQVQGPYSTLWKRLQRRGRVVDAPEVARSRMHTAYKGE